MRRLGALLKLTAAMIFAGTVAEAAPGADRPTPSGLPVPRYVSLKFDEVNARAGPSEEHRILWVYRVRGLPVQVVAENTEWRRICDPEHGLAWVHKRATDGRRMVLRAQASPLPMRKHPKDGAKPAALLAPHSLAGLVRCEDNGWCKLKVDGVSGWVRAGEVWGTDPRAQCG